VILTLIKHI